MGKQTARFGFGKRIRKLRRKSGWTQTELARRAGISKKYLQRIESKSPPNVTVDTIVKLARAFQLDIWEIIS